MDKACLWWDQMTSGIRRVGSRLVCQTESLPLGNQGSDANLARLVRIKRNRLQLPSYIERCATAPGRSEEHTSELQSLMRISYAVFCLKKKTKQISFTLRLSQNYNIKHNKL